MNGQIFYLLDYIPVLCFPLKIHSFFIDKISESDFITRWLKRSQ